MLAILYGALVAVPLVLSVGPGFLAQIHTGVNSGFRACVSVVAGLYGCAFLITIAAYVGVIRFLTAPKLRFGLSLFNGAVIIVWGALKVIQSHLPPDAARERPGKRAGFRSWTCALSGFFLTASNPMSVFFWVNIVTLAHINLRVPTPSLPFFSLGLFVSAVALDVTKCRLLAGSRKAIKPRVLLLINRAMGLLLIVIGAYLIVRAL
jgi:threonine/homoserine/homoserine lactone efflux protein